MGQIIFLQQIASTGKTVENRPFMQDENGIKTIDKEISLDEGLDYSLKQGRDNSNGNILLRRVVQAPALTEILKGPLKQYFWILNYLFKFLFKTVITWPKRCLGS